MLPHHRDILTITGGSEKFFFHNLLQPLPRHLQTSQPNASVQSLLLACIFFVQPIAAEGWREFLEKNIL